MGLVEFILPGTLIAVAGALTGRIWLALLPVVFMWSFAWGGLSISQAVLLMLVAAVAMVAVEAVIRRRRSPGA